MSLVDTLREESRVLATLADELADNRVGDEFEDNAFDLTVSYTVRAAARLLHAVGEHEFDLNDYPPES